MKEKTVTFNCKVKESTPDKLRKMAIASGYTYGKGAALGKFLDAIATLDPDLVRLILEKGCTKTG